MRRECQGRFPRHHGLAIPTCITTRASRTCRDACRDHLLAVSLEVGGGENVSGIPSACATRNFTYLVRGPCHIFMNRQLLIQTKTLERYCTNLVHICFRYARIKLTIFEWKPYHILLACIYHEKKTISGIILDMGLANERKCYIVTSSLLCWAQAKNDLWKYTREVLVDTELI